MAERVLQVITKPRLRSLMGAISLTLPLFAAAACSDENAGRIAAPSRVSSEPPTQSAFKVQWPDGFTVLGEATLGEECGVLPTAGGIWRFNCVGEAQRVSAVDGSESLETDFGAAFGTYSGVSPTASDTAWIPLHGRGSAKRLIGLVTKFNSSTGETSSVGLGNSLPIGVVTYGQSVISATLDGRLLRWTSSDPTPREVSSPGRPYSLIASDKSALWTLDEGGSVALRDLPSYEAREFKGSLSGTLAHAVVIDDDLWVAHGPGRVTRVSPAGDFTPVEVAGESNNITECGGKIWLSQQDLGAANSHSPGLRAINRKGKVLGEMVLPHGPLYISCQDNTRLWVQTEEGYLGSVNIIKVP